MESKKRVCAIGAALLMSACGAMNGSGSGAHSVLQDAAGTLPWCHAPVLDTPELSAVVDFQADGGYPQGFHARQVYLNVHSKSANSYVDVWANLTNRSVANTPDHFTQVESSQTMALYGDATDSRHAWVRFGDFPIDIPGYGSEGAGASYTQDVLLHLPSGDVDGMVSLFQAAEAQGCARY